MVVCLCMRVREEGREEGRNIDRRTDGQTDRQGGREARREKARERGIARGSRGGGESERAREGARGQNQNSSRILRLSSLPTSTAPSTRLRRPGRCLAAPAPSVDICALKSLETWWCSRASATQTARQGWRVRIHGRNVACVCVCACVRACVHVRADVRAFEDREGW